MPNVPAGVERVDMSRQAAQLAQPAAPASLGQRLRSAWAALTGRDPSPNVGQRDFNPGQPLQPRSDPKKEPTPRQFQYPVSANTFPTPRREMPGLTPFEQLRNLAAMYDVAAMCVATRIEEVQGLDWAIVARDQKRQAELQELCDEATAFWQSPDKMQGWHSWIAAALYDLFSIDALTIYRRPDLGGKLYGLELVDGSTIKPLLDDRGRTLAYQQVLYGYPFSEYKRPNTDAPDEAFPTFGREQLLYLPRWTRTFTPYGFPPTEWIILRVNTALRKQTFDLAWFTDGNVPEMIGSAPENLDPTQVENFEIWFNAALSGDDAARRKVHFIPWKMDMKEMKSFSYETALDEWMLRVTCAAYSVPPQELGFTDDVNKATSEMQEAVNERKGLKPLTKWLKDTLLDPGTREAGGMQPAESLPGRPTRPAGNRFAGIGWQWLWGDQVDGLVQAQTDQVYWNMGVVSAGEVRVMRYGSSLTGPSYPPPEAGVMAPSASPTRILNVGTRPMEAGAAKFFRRGQRYP